MKKIATILFLPVALLFVSCNDYDYDVVEDEMFVITEETSGPGTGYTWCWDKKDDIVDTLKRAFMPYNAERIGGPGVERWVFVGKRKGTTNIKMEHKQPWRSIVDETRTYSVRVK